MKRFNCSQRKLSMKKPANFINQALVIVGVVAVSAVVFQYSGKIQLKLGSDGINLQINADDSSRF